VGVGAVLDQEDVLLAAKGGDPLHVESEVPPDVHQPCRPRPVLERLALEVFEGGAEVVSMAVHEYRPSPRREHGQGRGREGVRGAEHRPVADAGEGKRRERGAGPT